MAHEKCMLGALAVSTVFLICYLIHQAQVGGVPFRHAGPLRTVSFAILIPHVILAAAVVRLAFRDDCGGSRGGVEPHRRIAG